MTKLIQNTLFPKASSDLETICKKFDLFDRTMEEIYCGKDHACRCGCCGKYHKPEGGRGYKMALTRVKKMLAERDCIVSGEVSDEIGVGTTYLNINYEGDTEDSKCCCIYFH